MGAGSLINFSFKFSNLCSSSFSHIISSFLNFSYRNLTTWIYPSIHILQCPNKPKSILISFLVFGGRSGVIPVILSGFNHQLPWLIICPKNFTSFSTNCSFSLDIQSPWFSKKFSNDTVNSWTSSSEGNKSSTYWLSFTSSAVGKLLKLVEIN